MTCDFRDTMAHAKSVKSSDKRRKLSRHFTRQRRNRLAHNALRCKEIRQKRRPVPTSSSVRKIVESVCSVYGLPPFVAGVGTDTREIVNGCGAIPDDHTTCLLAEDYVILGESFWRQDAEFLRPLRSVDDVSAFEHHHSTTPFFSRRSFHQVACESTPLAV